MEIVQRRRYGKTLWFEVKLNPHDLLLLSLIMPLAANPEDLLIMRIMP